ncbi:SDR family oxidoreductase [Candidatus Pacearchaeota archaeon]|nr:SDR family oxidoreductase [Candidatus Pacearchaeota archaeon]
MGKRVCVMGGAGYVGSALVPRLLERGDDVMVYDTYWYGDIFGEMRNCKLKEVRGDIRDRSKLLDNIKGMDAILHLACISNDPSFDLNPSLGRSINLDAFHNVLDVARQNPEARFVYASSSSVYGVKKEKEVIEEMIEEPLTDYSKFKLECEKILKAEARDLDYVIVRPATVCGYAPRLRLDVVVNILTINALERGIILVDGGEQTRPNIHVKDMVGVYEKLIDSPSDKTRYEIFNAGDENHSVRELAEIVRRKVPNATIQINPVKDQRSYNVNSDKIKRFLGFRTSETIESAVESIVDAYREGKIIEGLTNPIYHNIKRMKELNIS